METSIISRPSRSSAAITTTSKCGFGFSAVIIRTNAGRLEALRLVDGSVEVTWRPRGARRSRTWLVDRVVNCTGPDSRVTQHPDPLVRSLLANGVMRADSLALGIEVSHDGRVIGADGVAVDSLWYLGPWLRARDWEATAVPELRAHAARLAQRLAADPPLALSA